MTMRKLSPSLWMVLVARIVKLCLSLRLALEMTGEESHKKKAALSKKGGELLRCLGKLQLILQNKLSPRSYIYY